MAFKLATAFVELVTKQTGLDSGLDDARKKVMEEVGSIQSALAGIAAAAGGVAAVGVLARMGGEAEQTAVAINVILKDMEKTRALLAELNQFSVVTPFTPAEVEDAARGLLAARVEAEDIAKTLQFLGDAAAGSNSRLNEVVQIFNKIKNRGKATQEELNQFNERSINLSVVLQKQLGMTGDEFAKMVTRGELTFDKVVKGFEAMTSEGGIFFQAMQKQSTTLLGLWSTLVGNVVAVGRAIGTAMMPVLKPLAGLVISLFNAFQFIDKITGGLASKIIALGIAIGAVTAAIVGAQLVVAQFGITMTAVIAAVNTALVASGWGAIIVGIGIALAGIVFVIRQVIKWIGSLQGVQEGWKKATEVLGQAWDAFGRAFSAIGEAVMNVIRSIQRLFGVATEDLSEGFGDFLGDVLVTLAEMVRGVALAFEVITGTNEHAWDIMWLSAEKFFRKVMGFFGPVGDFVANIIFGWGRSLDQVSKELDAKVAAMNASFAKSKDEAVDIEKTEPQVKQEVSLKFKEFGFDKLVSEFQKSQLGKDSAARTADATAKSADSLASIDAKMSQLTESMGAGGGVAVATA